jgi:hypothetical protein
MPGKNKPDFQLPPTNEAGIDACAFFPVDFLTAMSHLNR